jgi:hypothetical protein
MPLSLLKLFSFITNPKTKKAPFLGLKIRGLCGGFSTLPYEAVGVQIATNENSV